MIKSECAKYLLIKEIDILRGTLIIFISRLIVLLNSGKYTRPIVNAFNVEIRD